MTDQDKGLADEETKGEEMTNEPVTAEPETSTGGRKEEGKEVSSPKDLRDISYFILAVAAIFVVNAMETGSYRTPWPVAIVVSLAGLALYGYSWYRQKQQAGNQA